MLLDVSFIRFRNLDLGNVYKFLEDNKTILFPIFVQLGNRLKIDINRTKRLLLLRTLFKQTV